MSKSFWEMDIACFPPQGALLDQSISDLTAVESNSISLRHSSLSVSGARGKPGADRQLKPHRGFCIKGTVGLGAGQIVSQHNRRLQLGI